MRKPEIDMVSTGARLRQLRKDLHLSTDEVASYLGLKSKTTVGNWERGEYLPRLDQALALRYLYRVSCIDELIRIKNKSIEGERK